MSTLVATRVREQATKLGLVHLAETAAELVARAEADQLGYLDFVDLLLGEELGLREGRRFRTALKLSGLPHHKTLEQFDFAFQPSSTPARCATSPRWRSSTPGPTSRCSAPRAPAKQ